MHTRSNHTKIRKYFYFHILYNYHHHNHRSALRFESAPRASLSCARARALSLCICVCACTLHSGNATQTRFYNGKFKCCFATSEMKHNKSRHFKMKVTPLFIGERAQSISYILQAARYIHWYAVTIAANTLTKQQKPNTSISMFLITIPNPLLLLLFFIFNKLSENYHHSLDGVRWIGRFRYFFHYIHWMYRHLMSVDI